MRTGMILAVLPALSAAVVEPGVPMAVIEAPHVTAYAPQDQVDTLRPLIAWSDGVLAAMAKDAGLPLGQRLHLVFIDERDIHNGFSTQLPLPVVQIELAPSPPDSPIHAGEGHLQQTIIHEFAHHLSNNRNPVRFRQVLESIFGRVLPFDVLSTTLWYLSTPAHQTMPTFWHEGLAQWAETTYADPAGAWAGRGRDSLTRMVWRLDAAAGPIPPVDDWRSSHHRWPYGNRPYLYGLAYLRALTQAHPELSPWDLVKDTGHWPFQFDGGARAQLGVGHAALIDRARLLLATEQEADLARLRQVPVLTTQRLTPLDSDVGAPIWLPDGRLLAAIDPPYRQEGLWAVDRAGGIERQTGSAWAMPNLRAITGGGWIRHEGTGRSRRGARRGELILTKSDGRDEVLPGERLVLPDAVRLDERTYRVVAIKLQPAAQQRLVLATIDPDQDDDADWQELPTHGRAWSPTFRPGGVELAWVETDTAGSRLVLAPVTDPAARRVLWQVPARILHPVWSADGAQVYCCSDLSGVANAYVLDVAEGGPARPVTHTIGGVIACVPSQDGRELAIVEHDRHGPHLAIIPADGTGLPRELPRLDDAWPQSRPLATTTPASELPPAEPYRGLTAIRPRFWSPVTSVVPTGGYGVLGYAGDPLLTHEVLASLGLGDEEQTPVGQLAWTYSGWPIDVRARVMQGELASEDQIRTVDGRSFDYVEQLRDASLSAGWGLSGLGFRTLAYASVGITDREAVDDAEDRYEDLSRYGADPFEGQERYAEVLIGYDDRIFFPTSFAREAGVYGYVRYRHSGLGGDLERDLVEGTVGSTIPIWRAGGHQLGVLVQAGWSDDEQEYLQSAFGLGGGWSQIPRGYDDAEVLGPHFGAFSLAYRLPVWRPMRGYGTTPFVFRQLFLEGFYDQARISSDHSFGDGDWFRSAGAILSADLRFADIPLQPGFGLARQLDGDEEWALLLTVGLAY